MNKLYPFKFKPIFKEKIWGGDKIKTELGLDYSPLTNCGESWVLSGVTGSETEVINGFLRGNSLNELLEVFMDDLVGENIFSKNKKEFPILVKFIDSRDYLSVQVHPSNALAARRKTGKGKTELWYVLDAEPNAILINGFNRKVNREIYMEYLNSSKIKEILNVEKVEKGDVYFIPAGRIHALGPGILLAEIQQTSDTTYRIYDWDRVDDKGNSRELHTELAIDAIDFNPVDHSRTDYSRVKNKTKKLVESNHFTTNIIDFDQIISKDYSDLDSFVIYVCIEGSAIIQYDQNIETLKKGETLLVPAVMERLVLKPIPSCMVLEVFIQ